MKIVYYCQHVLGIGHLIRSLEICKALDDHDVFLLTGGATMGMPIPSHVREVRLPGLMMDPDFNHLFCTDRDLSLDDVKKLRRERLLNLFEEERPHVFIVESYPFGRGAFRFELEPVLKAIRDGDLPPCRAVCSLRDIMAERADQDFFERRAVRNLNRYFDALLVHADPTFFKLDETFGRAREIAIPVIYTGFVTPKPVPNAGTKLRRHIGIDGDETLVLASAGGGRVGFRLLEAVARASRTLETDKAPHLYISSGPFMDDGGFERLQSMSGERVHVDRFIPDFLSYLAAADLSVSMAGYNTCMNILSVRVPALVWPFSQNREQGLRAKALARLGLLEILATDDLEPDRLAPIMERTLSRQAPPSRDIDLGGAWSTAKWLESWVSPPGEVR